MSSSLLLQTAGPCPVSGPLVALGGPPFFCPECGNQHPSRTNLLRHISAVHRRLKPHTCTLCGKSFSQKAALTAHVKQLHLHIKPYSCKVCSKSFGKKSALKAHMATHSKWMGYTLATAECHLGVKYVWYRWYLWTELISTWLVCTEFGFGLANILDRKCI